MIFLIYKGTDNMSGGGTGTGDLFNAEVQQLLKELNFRRLMKF
jgi:hypothetical protein